MYRYDIHVHCSENSSCAPTPGAEMARAYANAGYTGIVMTNHFLHGHQTDTSNMDWERECENFMRGYLNAKEEGEKCGLDVFFGWEFNYMGADLLTYGLGLDWLKSHPDMCSWSAKQYFDEVHKSGGYVIHAHPFRVTSYFEELHLFPLWEDAVEVYNGSHCFPMYDYVPAFNDRAEWYAKQYNKIMTAGSDTHGVEYGVPQRGGSMLFNKKLENISEMIFYIRNNRFKIDNL